MAVTTGLVLAVGCSDRFGVCHVGDCVAHPDASSGAGGEGSDTPNVAGKTSEPVPMGGTSATGGATNQLAPESAGEGNSGGEANAAGAGGASSSVCASIDTQSDKHNCGTCGHDCLGGECAKGTCQPLTLGENLGSFIKITSDSSYIYWTGDNSTIGRVNKRGGTDAEVLVPQSAKELGYDNVVVGQTLYWSNDWQDNGVRGCTLPACTKPATLLAGTLPARALHHSDTAKSLFWSQDKAMWTQALPAGSAKLLFMTQGLIEAITSDSTFLYWVEYDPDAKIAKARKRPLAGGAVEELATSLTGWNGGLVVVAGDLFLNDGAEKGLHHVPLPNGVGAEATDAFAISKQVGSAIAADEMGVYWGEATAYPQGVIRTCPRAGCIGTPPIIANSDYWATSMLIDSEAVYWGTDGGSIFELAR